MDIVEQYIEKWRRTREACIGYYGTAGLSKELSELDVLESAMTPLQRSIAGVLICHEITREKVEKRAYDLWEQAGRPEGRSEEFWLQAESLEKECCGTPCGQAPK